MGTDLAIEIVFCEKQPSSHPAQRLEVPALAGHGEGAERQAEVGGGFAGAQVPRVRKELREKTHLLRRKDQQLIGEKGRFSRCTAATNTHASLRPADAEASCRKVSRSGCDGVGVDDVDNRRRDRAVDQQLLARPQVRKQDAARRSRRRFWTHLIDLETQDRARVGIDHRPATRRQITVVVAV